MEADRIALAIFGSFNDALCDELTHSVEMREVPKRTRSLIKRGPHCADRLVIRINLGQERYSSSSPMKYGRERDTVSQSPRPESCFGDVTSLASGNDGGCSKQTVLSLLPAAIVLAG
jgi:hypothetical protein